MRASLTEEGVRLLGSTTESLHTSSPWKHLSQRSRISSSSSSSNTLTNIDLEKDDHPPRKPTPPAGNGANPSYKVRWRDLPNKPQLLILALCRLSEPLSNVCLLPYIFYLVRSVLDPSAHAASQPPTTTIYTVAAANTTVPSGFEAPAPGHSPGTYGHSPPASASDLSSQIPLISGLLVSIFPLAQTLISLPLGRLSDHHGRRPTILLGLLITTLANLFFGLSRTLPSLFFWRALAGAANGNVALMRTMTVEVVGGDRKFMSRAFLALPLVFNTGMVVSLALGGILADPMAGEGMPGLLGEGGVLEGVEGWLEGHPFALPSLMNAVVLGGVFVISFLGLRETLVGKEGDRDWGLRLGDALLGAGKRVLERRGGEGYEVISGSDEDVEIGDVGEKDEKGVKVEVLPLSPAPSSPSTTGPSSLAPPFPSPGPPGGKRKQPSIRSILTPKLTAALLSFSLLPLHNNAFMHLFPLYLSTPPPSTTTTPPGLHFTGGLGLPSSTIGPWLSLFGLLGILLQLFIYPRLQARLGTLGLFRLSTLTFPITYTITPLLSLLPPHSPAQYVLLALVSAAQILARTVAIPSTVILLTEAAPEKRVLGTVHGAGNMAASAARAVGPAVGGLIFAVGVRMGVIGLVWWGYLGAVSLGAAGWAWKGQKGEDGEEGVGGR